MLSLPPLTLTMCCVLIVLSPLAGQPVLEEGGNKTPPDLQDTELRGVHGFASLCGARVEAKIALKVKYGQMVCLKVIW